MSASREHPILFSGPMVRAILEGRKTQTRRVLKRPPHPDYCNFNPEVNPTGAMAHSFGEWFTTARLIDGTVPPYWAPGDEPGGEFHDRWWACPYGQPGDTLWVRETWALEDCGADGKRVIWQADRAAAWVLPGNVLGEIYYLPSNYEPGRWRPSIHMPRWASRLTLEVTEVCVQRLQEISEEDARAEGIENTPIGWERLGMLPPVPVERSETARSGFSWVWNSINGERPGCSWDANPWAWAVSFKVLEPQSTRVDY